MLSQVLMRIKIIEYREKMPIMMYETVCFLGPRGTESRAQKEVDWFWIEREWGDCSTMTNFAQDSHPGGRRFRRSSAVVAKFDLSPSSSGSKWMSFS